MRRIGFGVAAAVILVAAAPTPVRMSAALFLRKADSLRARGPFAFFSADLKKLQVEAESAGDSLHDEHAARMAAHERTDWCAPANKYLTPRELIIGMHAIPKTEIGRMDIKQAMRAVFERNYPCPR